MQCSEGLLAAKAYAMAEVHEAPLRPTIEMERVQVNDPRQRVTLPGIGRARPSRPSPDPASGRCALPPSPPASAPDRRTPVNTPKPSPVARDVEDATPEPSDAPARTVRPARGGVTAGVALAIFVVASGLALVLRLRAGTQPPPRPATVAPPSAPNAVLVADPVETADPAPVLVPSDPAPKSTAEPRATRAPVIPAKTAPTADPRATTPAPAPTQAAPAQAATAQAAPTQAPNRLFGLQQ
jgi:hypothetical protein